ncbi:hypothetical protein ABZU76_45045 [Amycolatopsis sp. NPDC005232]|uniref:hypothetical protein n=1 Tax=Amycolatopsis sp. NPDC005232 TaxID=3157027 RepID=UPI0033B8663B
MPYAVSTTVFALVLAVIFLLWQRFEKPCPSTTSPRRAARCSTGSPSGRPSRSAPRRAT